jgi:hypothetical protein
VLRNSVSPIMSGVAWKVPGRAARVLSVSGIGASPVAHVHATPSAPTFARSIAVSGE